MPVHRHRVHRQPVLRRGQECGHFGDLWLRLLDPVLAEDARAGAPRRSDRFRGLRLADRDQRYTVWVPACPACGICDPLLYGGDALTQVRYR